MMPYRISVAVAALAMLGPAGAGETAGESTLVLITTQARVEVNAEGKVTAVQPDAKLTPAVAQAIQATVGAWRFVPPVHDGQSVGGVTYVQIGACAVDVDGGLRMAFDYQGNGPRRQGPPTPRPPSSMRQIRPGETARMKLTYRVGADGVGEVESVDRISGKADISKAFGSSLRDWIGASTFEPELVAGKPVATRMSLPFEFTVLKLDRARARMGPKAVEQALAAERPTCQTALGNAGKQDRAVALDSPFTLLPSG